MPNISITDTPSLGDVIRKTRQGLGLTQPTLALGAGVGVRFIVDIESGKPTAQIGKVIRVLATLGIAIALDVPDAPKTTARAHAGS